MAKKPTKTTVKITAKYEDAVRAFLQTPPEKKKPKTSVKPKRRGD